MRIFSKYHICNNLALGQIPEKLNFDSICVYFANSTFATNPQLLGTMFKFIKRQHLCNTLATGGFAAGADPANFLTGASPMCRNCRGVRGHPPPGNFEI